MLAWPRITWASRGRYPEALEQGGRGAAQVVEHDRRQAGGGHDPIEGAGDVARLDRPAGACGEHVTGLGPLGARGGSLRGLSPLLGEQGGVHQGHQGQDAFTGAPHE